MELWRIKEAFDMMKSHHSSASLRVLLKWICKRAMLLFADARTLRGQLNLLKQNDVCEPIVHWACSQLAYRQRSEIISKLHFSSLPLAFCRVLKQPCNYVIN